MSLYLSLASQAMHSPQIHGPSVEETGFVTFKRNVCGYTAYDSIYSSDSLLKCCTEDRKDFTPQGH